MPFELALESIEILKQAEKDDFISVEWITPERFENALALRKKFSDKPGISFTDITTMTVMNELGIEKIITADQHFYQVGFPFQLLP